MRPASATLAEMLEAQLMRDEGALLSGDALRRALGYRSLDALRQAIARGTVPVPVFTLPHRRGRFALARDVAYWLATQAAPDADPAHRQGGREGSPM